LEGPLRHHYRFLEELFNGSLKNPGLKGSLLIHKWCLQEPYFEDPLMHLNRFPEELFKDMVLYRTLV